MSPPCPPPSDPTANWSDNSIDTDPSPGERSRWWTRTLIWVPAALLIAFGVLYGADLALAGDEIPRNTRVGGVMLGGLSRPEAASRLDDILAAPVSAPREVVAGQRSGRLNSGAAGIALDVEGSIRQAAAQPLNPITRLVSLFASREVPPVLAVDADLLAAAIDEFGDTADRPVVEGAITFDGTEPVAVQPEPGIELDRRGAAFTFVAAIRDDPADRGEQPVSLPIDEIAVSITAEEVQRALETVAGPALSAPIVLAAAGDSPAPMEIPVSAIAASLRFTPDSAGHLEAKIDPESLQAAMGPGLEPFSTPGQDARFEIVGGAMTVVASVDGMGIDLPALSEAIETIMLEPAPRQIEAHLVPAPAGFTTEAANALGITEVVSSFTTNYTSTASGENIRLVAAEVYGAVIAPGETFSLNGYTGQRTEAEGYVPAGVIIAGEFQQAVGGGISQFATTTFNAVFFAGLEDVYHKPHSYYISRYPAGREATVFYDSIDLVFRNDQPTGIYIETIWSPGSLTVTFWGVKQVDVESVSSERRNFRSPQTEEKPDDGSCVPSGGSTGFDITVTRVFHPIGSAEVLRSEDFVTRYNAEPRIVCVPVPPPPSPPGLVSPGLARETVTRETRTGARARPSKALLAGADTL